MRISFHTRFHLHQHSSTAKMLVQTIVSAAVLATAANAASHESRHPYRLAVMALPGQSLMRRGTNGYTPDLKQCKAGNTCAEACGAGFDQCPGGKPDTAHCFNPTAGESCCTDNSGSTCLLARLWVIFLFLFHCCSLFLKCHLWMPKMNE